MITSGKHPHLEKKLSEPLRDCSAHKCGIMHSKECDDSVCEHKHVCNCKKEHGVIYVLLALGFLVQIMNLMGH